MRLLVCGGRDYDNRPFVFEKLDQLHALNPITCVIEGGAKGADRLGREWAISREIPVETYEADWDAHGYSAGPIRNWEMLRKGKPTTVVAFPGGKGTAHMVKIARENDVPVVLFAPQL